MQCNDARVVSKIEGANGDMSNQWPVRRPLPAVSGDGGGAVLSIRLSTLFVFIFTSTILST